ARALHGERRRLSGEPHVHQRPHLDAARGPVRSPRMSAFGMFDVAGSALAAQSLRLNLTASNIANMHNVAGDPAEVYRARHALFQAQQPFADVLAGVEVRGIVESDAPPIERYDPGHPEANEEGIVYATSVNAMEEQIG